MERASKGMVALSKGMVATSNGMVALSSGMVAASNGIRASFCGINRAFRGMMRAFPGISRASRGMELLKHLMIVLLSKFMTLHKILRIKYSGQDNSSGKEPRKQPDLFFCRYTTIQEEVGKPVNSRLPKRLSFCI